MTGSTDPASRPAGSLRVDSAWLTSYALSVLANELAELRRLEHLKAKIDAVEWLDEWRADDGFGSALRRVEMKRLAFTKWRYETGRLS